MVKAAKGIATCLWKECYFIWLDLSILGNLVVFWSSIMIGLWSESLRFSDGMTNIMENVQFLLIIAEKIKFALGK